MISGEWGGGMSARYVTSGYELLLLIGGSERVGRGQKWMDKRKKEKERGIQYSYNDPVKTYFLSIFTHVLTPDVITKTKLRRALRL